jgi:hypothetical protein
MCGRCGDTPASNCGHLEVTKTDAGDEHDCNFWFNDTLMPDGTECDDCPLCWCQDCKDEMAVNGAAFAKIAKRKY